jgi:hypothetical protein
MLTNYFVLRWDDETLSYIFIEHWGIKQDEVKPRYEKLCKEFGKQNLVIATNLDVIKRADARAMVKILDKKLRKESRDKRLRK